MYLFDENNSIEQRVSQVQRQSELLCQNAIDSHSPHQIAYYIEELREALEELCVAEEELKQQNEELMAARQSVEQERQRYQELFEFAPDGYVVTDIHGTVREANCAAAALLNLAPQYLVGKPLINFVADEQRREFRSMLLQLQRVHRLQEWEVRLCPRQKAAFEAALTVAAVRNHYGQSIALRWLMRDITARKQAESHLHQVQLQNLELIESNRLKNQFMGIISHELRTPMNAILGFSDLLLRRFHDRYEPQQIAFLERILNNAKHLLLMIEEILAYSRLKAHRLELQLEAFDLLELARITAEEMQCMADQKALALELDLPPSPLVVCNDRTRVRQILVNLLSNAIKFTDTGRVTLAIAPGKAEKLLITVQDTGIGIDPAHQGRIFQEFWQVNQSQTRSQGGTGLGLSITSSLVTLMQGKIWVESELGEGAVFRIELPRNVPSPPIHPEQDLSPDQDLSPNIEDKLDPFC
uniref:Circadian input-output histidine kinase CikA n=1 Tax=Cyanothece sp. (strain PCC 7425 / ATCC 29141) TaxID=395961 RepID=B8HMX7_CYAP4